MLFRSLTDEDMSDLLGNQTDGEAVTGNVSTETAMLVQNRIDMQTYIYMDNFAKAMQRGGQIWLGMAKEVYSERERAVKVISESDKVSQKIIRQRKLNDIGQPYEAHDLTKAKMDVMSSVGPSSSTAKQAIIKNLMNASQISADPATQDVLTSAMLTHMQGEGLDDIRDFFRMKLVRMGVVNPTPDEEKKLAEEAQNQTPPAEQEYLLAEAEKARAQAGESQADILLKQAKAEETRAKTAEILQNVDASQQTQAIQAIKELGPTITPPDVTGVSIQN